MGVWAREISRASVSERLLIRRLPVEQRDGDVVEPQVDGQLAPVMGEMRGK
jgi:hypothetical protein